jgi:NAD(P)-dependent dehydrogenase (short-subunit alcohol dehydrogenase family)
MSVLDAFAVPGRVAVVTGGNRGLGPAFSHAIGEAGARVAAVARDAAASETVLGELRAKGVDAEAFTADVRDRTALGAAARVMDRSGAVDILANNAGTCIHRPALEVTDAACPEVIDVNLTNLWNRCPVSGQLMVEAGAGVIVNVGSMSGGIVNRPQGQLAHNASKAGCAPPDEVARRRVGRSTACGSTRSPRAMCARG